MTQKRILPPTYFMFFIVLMAVLHFLLPVAVVVHYPWWLMGGVPLALGIVLNLVADHAFKQYQTTVKPYEESSTLMTSGVFRLSRNPMYLGMVLILVGIAVLVGSLTPFVVIPFFIVLMNRVYITVEERMLEQKFGENWQAYVAKVRRWI
jgi:protein-S-isoprenylcysteine O-methyltransferase Ste14